MKGPQAMQALDELSSSERRISHHGWAVSTVGQSCAIRNDLRLPLSEEVRDGMSGPYPYFGPTGALDHINEYRLDGRFALIGEDGDHFLKFRERPMTLFVTGKLNVNNHAHVVADSELCDAKWFYYCFLHKDLYRSLTRQGAGRYKLTRAALEKLPIPLPPLADQRYMIGVLDQFEWVASELKRLLQLKGVLKRGLMQQLLTGQKRFPEFKGTAWKSSRLGDHVETVNRRSTGDVTRVLTASGVHGLVDQRRYFNRNVAGADLSRYFLLRKGEFAYNRSAMNGYPYGATKRLDEHDEGALSTLYLCFAIKDPQLDSDYLKHVFDSGVLNRQLRPIVRIGARAHGLLNVSDEDYLSISIPLPQNVEQRRIADVLNMLDREVDLLAELQVRVGTQKRALLSRFLAGELSLPLS